MRTIDQIKAHADACARAGNQVTLWPADVWFLLGKITSLEQELQVTREVLQFADGGFVAHLGRGIADLYAEDAPAQKALHDAGCWPRGSDHTTPTAGRGSPVADGW